MGGAESKASSGQPDILSVVTLSDSAVQRLPLVNNDTPLEKEIRYQNIDDFWRDRLDCMEQAFAESRLLTEKEFRRLEFKIKKMAPGQGKLLCSSVVEDVKTCYLTYPEQPLNCKDIIKKLEICLDTIVQESAKKRHEEDKRKARKAQRC